MLHVQKSRQRFKQNVGSCRPAPSANALFLSNGYFVSNATPQETLKSTKRGLLLKGTPSLQAWISTTPLHLSSESTPFVLSLPLPPQMTFSSCMSIVRMPSYTEKATLTSTSQPEWFVDTWFPQKVLHLHKSLYGLKKAPCIWYLFLCGLIIDLGFVALESDICIYIWGQLLVAVYVDDIEVVGNQKNCETFYHELANHIKVKNKAPSNAF